MSSRINRELRESRLVRIDNRDRTSGSLYNFTVNFNDYLLHNVQRMLLKSVYIPNTQYNVNSNKNELVYDAGAGTQTITVTPGQYNLTELMAELTTEFAGAVPPVTFGYTFDTNTSKLNITTNPATTLFGTQSSMAELIGLQNTDIGPSAIHQMPFVVNLTGLQKVYIASNALAKGVVLSSSDKVQFPIWTEIAITVPYGQVQHRILSQLNSIDESTHSVPYNVSTADIRLYDQDLNDLDLNGASVQLVFKAFNSIEHAER